MKAFGYSLAAAAAVLSPAVPAAAHDFWMQPSAFRVAPGQPVSVRFLIGDPGKVEHWAAEWRKVVSLQDFGPVGVTDRLAAIRPLDGATPDIARIDATVTFAAPGTHMLAFVSNHAVNSLPAAAFEAYARHEGLTLPLARRATDKTAATPGRELYSRRAKLLIQVGAGPSDTVSSPIGQTLEIVPAVNPYTLKPGAPLRLRIWFRGAPLAGASVVLEQLGPGATHGTPVLSDSNGDVNFVIDRSAASKVNVVWSAPIDDPRADYETVFSSLTFGAIR